MVISWLRDGCLWRFICAPIESAPDLPIPTCLLAPTRVAGFHWTSQATPLRVFPLRLFNFVRSHKELRRILRFRHVCVAV